MNPHPMMTPQQGIFLKITNFLFSLLVLKNDNTIQSRSVHFRPIRPIWVSDICSLSCQIDRTLGSIQRHHDDMYRPTCLLRVSACDDIMAWRPRFMARSKNTSTRLSKAVHWQVLIRISARLFQSGPLIRWKLDIYNYITAKSEARAARHDIQGLFTSQGMGMDIWNMDDHISIYYGDIRPRVRTFKG